MFHHFQFIFVERTRNRKIIFARMNTTIQSVNFIERIQQKQVIYCGGSNSIEKIGSVLDHNFLQRMFSADESIENIFHVVVLHSKLNFQHPYIII